jgi:hypothetical protein
VGLEEPEVQEVLADQEHQAEEAGHHPEDHLVAHLHPLPHQCQSPHPLRYQQLDNLEMKDLWETCPQYSLAKEKMQNNSSIKWRDTSC